MAAENELEVTLKAVDAGVAKAIEPVLASLQKMREAVEAFTGPVGKTIGELKKLGEAFLIFEAVDKIEAFIEKLEDMATAALKLGAVMGATIEQVSDFRGVLIAVGGNDASGTVRAMEHLQRMMSSSLADPAGHAAQAFKNLGFSIKDLQANENDFYGTMELLRNSFQGHQQGANMTANMYAVLGRQFDNLIPVLRLTDEEFAKAQQRFRDTGSNIAPFAAKLFESGELLRTFQQSLTGVSLQIYSLLQPAMDGFVKVLTDVVEWLMKVIENIRHFLDVNPDIITMSTAFGVLADSVLAILEPFAKLVALIGEIGGNVAFNLVLKGITIQMQQLAIAAAAVALGIEAVRIIYEKFTQSNVAADRAANLQRERNAIEYEQASLDREDDQSAAVMAKREKLGARIRQLDSEIGKAHAEAAAIAAENVQTILDKELAAWEKLGSRVKAILSGIPAAVGNPNRGDKYRDQYSGVDNKPVAPLGGKGSHEKDPKNYMQEWRQTLDEQLTSTQDYFRTSKATELAYWTEKLAWTKANSATILKELQADGLTALQAKKKEHELEIQLQSTVFNLTKEEANRAFQDDQKRLNDKMAMVKNEFTEKTKTETQWYNETRALQEQVLANLKRTGQQSTAAWDDAMKKMDDINKEHTKNIADQWNAVLDWITNKFDTMLTGVLQGTQTWTQAITKLWQNMAVSFIEQIAKMTLRWLVFQALTQAGAGGIAKAVGNPFSQALGNAGTMLGGLGGGAAGGAASAAGGAAATAATKGLTTAIASNTASTVSNTGGITSWISQQLASLAQFLGLTVATTTEIGTTADLTINILLLMEVLLGLMASVDALAAATTALTAVMAANVAKPFATGAWSIPHDMHAIVHAGEMIIPAKQAETLRSGSGLNFGGATAPSAPSGGGGGGGGGNNFYINAIDARSFQSYLQDNGHLVVGALATQARNGNRSGMNTANGHSRRP